MTTQTVPAVNGGPKTQVQVRADPLNNLRNLLEQSKKQIAVALPKHMTAERMIRVAITAFHRTPALQECSPLSIVGCVIQASELGLELTGPLGQAYMVPYRNKHTGQKEAQFQVGYRGLIDLAYRSGRVQAFPAHTVYANDHFRFAYGTKPFIEHRPTMDDPGEPVAFYAVLAMTNGCTDFEVMSKAQVDAHRRRYSKSASNSPWDTAYEEMAKKTVIRRLAKRSPVSIEFQRAAVLDEYAEAGIPQGLVLDVAAGEQSMLPVGRTSLRVETSPVATAEPEPQGMVEYPHNESQEQTAPADQEIDMAYGDWRDDYGERLKAAETPLALQEVGRHLTGTSWLTDAQRKECMELYQSRYAHLVPDKSQKRSKP